jgi:hypothetical protein
MLRYVSKVGEAGLRVGSTEWVCPAGYTTKKARETFTAQMPSSVVSSIVRIPEL